MDVAADESASAGEIMETEGVSHPYTESQDNMPADTGASVATNDLSGPTILTSQPGNAAIPRPLESTAEVDMRMLDYAVPLDTNLQCPICHSALLEPARLPCDHTFCGACLRAALRAQPASDSRKSCPACRTRVNISGSLSERTRESPDFDMTNASLGVGLSGVDDRRKAAWPGEPLPRFVEHLLDDLPVRCPFQQRGCSLVLRRGDVLSHVRLYCSFAPVACPLPSCELSVTRKDREQKCLHVKKACMQCGLEVMEQDQEVCGFQIFRLRRRS